MYDLSCPILEHTPLQAGYWVLTVQAGDIARTAKPGQFVHVRLPDLEHSALRRPFSIFSADASGILKILYKTVGRGTASMNQLTAAREVRIMGPLGNGFPLTPEGTPLLIAGGYGVAPLCFLASRLPQKGYVLVGGRSADDILACDVIRELGWELLVATQDGSYGEHGLVTGPLDRLLAQFAAQRKRAELFACGPDGMLKAVGQRAIEHDCKGWLSLDKHMVCGVGACLACVQALRRPDGSEWIGRVCHDGPIFEAREIIW